MAGEEPSPKGETESEPPFICPKCGKGDTVVATTKRPVPTGGRYIKCHACGYDTARPEDWGTRRDYVKLGAECLKAEFPWLTLARNHAFPFNPVTGREADQRVRYDYGAYLLGDRLEKLRFLTVRNTDVGAYLRTPEQYLWGDMDGVDYVTQTDVDALYVFYFPDAHPVPVTVIGEARRMKPFLTKVKDRFGNDQYHVPDTVREALLATTHEDKAHLLTRRYAGILLERQGVL